MDDNINKIRAYKKAEFALEEERKAIEEALKNS